MKWIIANWKSNKTVAEGIEWVEKVGPGIHKSDNFKVVVCPTFSSLSEIKKKIQIGGYQLMVGSQNISQFSVGAYTGEEAAQLLKDLVDLTIIGHSERRENFNETDQIVSEKVKRVKESQIIPLVCVQGMDTPVPDGVKLVAYEPIFAIGSGHPDTPEDANKVAKHIKEIYGEDIEILYGGSVTSSNVKSFLFQPDLAGVLVGKASLDEAEFVEIIKIAQSEI